MGSSSGPNCVANMHFMVDAIRKSRLHLSSAQPTDLQYFFCDLPSNDFNALLQLLADSQQPPSDDPEGLFCAAVAGSVYGRLFPASSLHLVFSSLCVHWLSQVPRSVSIPGTAEWNEGKTWVDGPFANEATKRAYSNQWQRDMKMFLQSRDAELAKGGMMMVLTLCRPNSSPSHQILPHANCYRLLEVSWKELIEERVLEQSDLDSFNLPIYLPTLEEITSVVRSVPSLQTERLEIFEEPIGEDHWRQWSHDPHELSTRIVNFYKSIFWNVIERHVGNMKCDAIFTRFKELLMPSLQSRLTNWDPLWVYPWTCHAILHIFKHG